MNHSSLRATVVAGLITFSLAGQAGLDTNFQPSEVLVSDPTMGLRGIIDPEFDSANNRFCWADRQGYLWVGYINPSNGEFDPPNGRGKLVDTDVVTTGEIGNGPEWVFTDHGPDIAYTLKFGSVDVLARAYLPPPFERWETRVLQGSYFRRGPIGSMDRGDTTPGIAYQGPNPGAGFNAIYVRELTDASTEIMIPSTDTYRTPGARWVDGQNSVIFTRPMPEGSSPPRQIFKYNMFLQQLEQLTFDKGNKIAAFMWRAPEYNNEYVIMSLIGEKKLRLYRYLDEDGDGTFSWTNIQTINPPSTGNFIWSPEPFVYDGKSYLTMVTSTSNDQQSLTIPSEIWMTDIDPDDTLFRKLSDGREVNRKDPEVYISEQGPYVYASVAEQVDGPDIYRFDTGLGPQAQQAQAPE